MNISRINFDIPVICIDNFLSVDNAQIVLDECLGLKGHFVPAMISDGQSVIRDETSRWNEVVYIDEVFERSPQDSAILSMMAERIWSEECKRIWSEGNYIFEMINCSKRREIVLSRYGDSNFYHPHEDTKMNNVQHRLVTVVYYINRVPECFTGGDFKLRKGRRSLVIRPKHNRAIIFPSSATHEVEEVHLKPNIWELGRFSINYWIGFQ